MTWLIPVGRAAGNFLAAGMLGLLVGLYVGMAVSPVVAAVLALLAAGAMTLLGLREPAPATPVRVTSAAPLARVGGFSLLCALGTLGGVWLRAHDAFAPSINVQVDEWTQAGFSPEDARTIVMYRRSGLLPAGKTALIVQDPTIAKADRPTPTVLYGEAQPEHCSDLDPRNYRDVAETLKAFRQQREGPWKDFADVVEKHVGAKDQAAALQQLWSSVCNK